MGVEYNNNINNSEYNNSVNDTEKIKEIKKRNLNLKKLKISLLITIIVFLLNILIIGSIYFSLHISKNDLDDLNNSLNKVNIMTNDLKSQNNTLSNLSLTELKYSSLLSNIEDELNELIINKSTVDKDLVKLNNDVYNVELENSQLENQIVVLEGRLK